jgi:hypothetical protein
MIEYVARVSKEARTDLINHEFFQRTFDAPLHEHVVDIVKNLGVIPGINFKGYELIPFAETMTINKKHTKNKKIAKNTKLTQLHQITDTDIDLLRFSFEIDVDGKKTTEEREMYVYRPDKHGFYRKNGKLVLPINQVIDSTTYVKDGINFKTAIFNFPIKIKGTRINLSTDDGTDIKGRRFNITVFKKECNILLYFLAKMNFEGVLDFFKLKDIINLVPEKFDEEKFVYYEVADNIFMECSRESLKYQFIADMYLTLIDTITPIGIKRKSKKGRKPNNSVSFKNLFSKKYWLITFAESFSKPNEKIGRNGLISFERILDASTIKRFSSIKIEHRRDIYTIARYILINYDLLMTKDNLDLSNKRIRNTEVIASYLDKYIRNNINSVLNAESVDRERLSKLLNTITHDTLMKATNGKDSYDLFKYDRFNDFTAGELSRYTFKGNGGIPGNKHKTSTEQREIHPSHIGIIDLNVTSASNPGLTGNLCANVKLYNGGRLSAKKDPDASIKLFELLDEVRPIHDHDKHQTIQLELHRDGETNKIKLIKRKSVDEEFEDIINDPHVLHIGRNKEGKIVLVGNITRNKNGKIMMMPQNKEFMMQYDVRDPHTKKTLKKEAEDMKLKLTPTGKNILEYTRRGDELYERWQARVKLLKKGNKIRRK